MATHVLARRRHAVSGRFGLRATPGGIGTPAFGPPDAARGRPHLRHLPRARDRRAAAGSSRWRAPRWPTWPRPSTSTSTADFTVGNDTPDRRRRRRPAPARSRRSRRAGGLVRPRLACPRHHRPHRRPQPRRSSCGPSTSTPAACSRSVPARTIAATSACPRRPPPRRAVPLRRAVGRRAAQATRRTGTRPSAPCSLVRPSRRSRTPSPSIARACPASSAEPVVPFEGSTFARGWVDGASVLQNDVGGEAAVVAWSWTRLFVGGDVDAGEGCRR